MLRTAALRGVAAEPAGVAVMTTAEKVEQLLTRRPRTYVPGRTLLALVAERPPEWAQPAVWNHAQSRRSTSRTRPSTRSSPLDR
ncbi:MAG TPA: hypothetical protein VFQ48_01645 [Pseudonocardiaceae bacterium]|nr:hypothetical protein [Pseudonocardiaceae bacterium]